MDDECVTNMDMERDAVLNVRVPSDVKEALKRASDNDHGRSVSGMVVRALREWLAERNYLKLEPSPAAPRVRRTRKGR